MAFKHFQVSHSRTITLQTCCLCLLLQPLFTQPQSYWPQALLLLDIPQDSERSLVPEGRWEQSCPTYTVFSRLSKGNDPLAEGVMFKMFSTTIRGLQTTPLEANLAFCLPTFVNKVLLTHRAYSVLSAAISCLGGRVKQLQVRPCEF